MHTSKVDLLAFSSMAACIDVFPLRDLRPSTFIALVSRGKAAFLRTPFGTSMSKVIKLNTNLKLLKLRNQIN